MTVRWGCWREVGEKHVFGSAAVCCHDMAVWAQQYCNRCDMSKLHEPRQLAATTKYVVLYKLCLPMLFAPEAECTRCAYQTNGTAICDIDIADCL